MLNMSFNKNLRKLIVIILLQIMSLFQLWVMLNKGYKGCITKIIKRIII